LLHVHRQPASATMQSDVEQTPAALPSQRKDCWSRYTCDKYV